MLSWTGWKVNALVISVISITKDQVMHFLQNQNIWKAKTEPISLHAYTIPHCSPYLPALESFYFVQVCMEGLGSVIAS